jgi:histone acetyltransferase (RNA polymerase elongator complex component)
MAINTYNLQAVKKELQHLSAVQMAELCLRLAKYKKDNKELLSYLLFEANHNDDYVESIKQEMQLQFAHLPAHYYYANKTARKILTLINKHVKFISTKPVEIDLLINYCQNYLLYVDKRTNYKPLRQVIVRQLERIGKLIASLHEDLQFDHQSGFEKLVSEADEKLSWVNKHDFL